MVSIALGSILGFVFLKGSAYPEKPTLRAKSVIHSFEDQDPHSYHLKDPDRGDRRPNGRKQMSSQVKDG